MLTVVVIILLFIVATLSSSAHVGEHLFKELICGFLRGRTRILVTHQVAMVVPVASLVVCLDGTGGIAACCTPRQLPAQLAEYLHSTQQYVHSTQQVTQATLVGSESTLARQRDFFTLLSNLPGLLTPSRSVLALSALAHSHTSGSSEGGIYMNDGSNLGGEGSKLDDVPDTTYPHSGLAPTQVLQSSDDGSSGSSGEDSNDGQEGEAVGGRKPAAVLVAKESKSSGVIGLDVYWVYLTACGGFCSMLMILFGILVQPVANFGNNYTLSVWMSAMELGWPKKDISWALTNYMGTVVGVVVLSAANFVNLGLSTLVASKSLHDSMLDRVIGATLTWHDSQPGGRKINRFSQDMDAIDGTVMDNVQGFLFCLFNTVQIIGVVVWLVPILVPILLPVLWYNYYIAGRYVTVSREIKRLESISKSPVFVLLSESLAGISVVRGFRHEERFLGLCCQYVDTMNR